MFCRIRFGPASRRPESFIYRDGRRGRFHAAGRCGESQRARLRACLHNSRCRTAEQIHLRLLERTQASRIAIGRGAEPTVARYREAYFAALRRYDVARFVRNPYGEIDQIFAVGRQFRPVRRDDQVMGLARCADDPFGYCFARVIVGYDFHFAGFVARIGPHQPVAVLNGQSFFWRRP